MKKIVVGLMMFCFIFGLLGGNVLANESDMIQLSSPTNLRWEGNWRTSWDGEPDSEGYYHLEIYKDGEFFSSDAWEISKGEIISTPNSIKISEDGSYTFRVREMSPKGTVNFTTSEWSEYSEERIYVRPDSVLSVQKVYWDDREVGLLHYNTVADAGGYQINLYRIKENEEFLYCSIYWVSDGFRDVAGEECIYDLSNYMLEEAKYYATIRALSGNIDKIANGVLSEPTEIFDTSKSAEEVGIVVAEVMKSGTSFEALQQITDKLPASAVANAMQTSDEVLKQIAELEALYAEELGIEVAKPVVSEEASEYVESSKVNVVGAGLNTEENAIGLEIDVPENKEYISGQNYKNSVQLDIKLVKDGSTVHGDLTMPITITMPIPEEVDARHLVILHYNQHDVAEKLNFRVNGNGTVTFTVKSLSTFVFAEENPFSDVDVIAWYYPYAKFAVDNNLMAGKDITADGKIIFDPLADMTRAEFVQVLYSKEGKPTVNSTNKFPDVEAGQWYENAIVWASENGIVTGYDDGTFGVEDNVTREQIATMLRQYANYKGYDTSVIGADVFKGHPDAGTISSWAVENMKWAVSRGIMNGTGDGSLMPQGNTLRAEAATMLKALVEAY